MHSETRLTKKLICALSKVVDSVMDISITSLESFRETGLVDG